LRADVPPALAATAAAQPPASGPPALARLAVIEALAQQELARTARLPMTDVPGRDDLLAILVAWDLAL